MVGLLVVDVSPLLQRRAGRGRPAWLCVIAEAVCVDELSRVLSQAMRRNHQSTFVPDLQTANVPKHCRDSGYSNLKFAVRLPT